MKADLAMTLKLRIGLLIFVRDADIYRDEELRR